MYNFLKRKVKQDTGETDKEEMNERWRINNQHSKIQCTGRTRNSKRRFFLKDARCGVNGARIRRTLFIKRR